ncbi:MAG TPA: SAM-dependent methyltransferase, partial [Myxococcota bacterium]|nr:SAM-dependent methyltransferase [Myxococcota bacterium]
FDTVKKARDELAQFILMVEQCADRGPLPPDNKTPAREVDARYDPDLDDGVMVNSAALWPLLEPQWKDPKKWWKELAEGKGRKDYDWSHLAMRYWPTRVDAKCQTDPSLAVAHGAFWRYHPERAWAWELRLQDEIAADFRITESPYRPGGRDLGDQGDALHRIRFLEDQPALAIAAIEKEAIRRMGRGTKRKLVTALTLLETGLWTDHAGTLYELELTLSERQGHELRILAPDEEDVRATFEQHHPKRVADRHQRLAELVPPPDLFTPDDSDSEDPDNPDLGESTDSDEDTE